MIPIDVKRRLLDLHQIRSVQPMPPGNSGAVLFRCQGDQAFALRGWPIETAVERVREIHQVISTAARSCTLLPQYASLPPDGPTYLVDRQGRIWELASWLPGQPFPYDATFEQIADGAAAIATVHRHLQPIGQSQRPAAAIDQRIRRTRQLSDLLPTLFDINLEGRLNPLVAGEVSTARELLRRNWHTSAQRILETLLPQASRPRGLHYVLRDIHREHALVVGGRISGIIDFDALRVDTPAADLSRWATSFSVFSQDSARTIDCVLAGYFGIQPLEQKPASAIVTDFPPADTNVFGPDFRTLVETLATSSLWISLANWVVWLVIESRQFPDFQSVALRLRRLIDAAQRSTER
ncbi:phosphotransferase [Stieleria sp. TO1_6]|uniref:phosphotransferase n=1 Tax=Stieleria tagensis TaxID=2956795 RepID=UPI00209B2085|nr:phosphotransferase [Stieleria tagensis]MCO8121878.1 phosphotransferase [Stieleria tagensis]